MEFVARGVTNKFAKKLLKKHLTACFAWKNP